MRGAPPGRTAPQATTSDTDAARKTYVDVLTTKLTRGPGAFGNVRFPPIAENGDLSALATLVGGAQSMIHPRWEGRAMRPFTSIAAAIFLLIALAHLYRILVGFPVVVGTFQIGQSVSWVALVVTMVLAAGLFREARH